MIIHDWRGRRIRKTVAPWNPATSNYDAPTETTKFVWDGWHLMSEIVNGATARSYVWGPDLSGTLDGAGGVGGLLMVIPAGENPQMVFSDANGNVTMLADVKTGEVTAEYEYGPFGELIRMTGELADENPLRFSSKYQDGESGLLYYGYRYYDGVKGSWLARDYIEEEGGLNLVSASQNDLLNRFDALGLVPSSASPSSIPIVWSSIDLGIANKHYRTGGGKAVRISFSLVNTSNVRVADDFNDVEEWLEDQVYWNPIGDDCKAGSKEFKDARFGFTTKDGSGDAEVVLGDITLKFIGKSTIDCKCKYSIIGEMRSYDDKYDFDFDRDRPWRSVKTFYASWKAGTGAPYPIEIRGSKTVNETGTQGYVY